MTDWYNILKLIVKKMREMIILWEVRLITYRVKKKKKIKKKKNTEEDLCEPAFILYFMNISLD